MATSFMPIEVSTEATIRSMRRERQEQQEAHLEASAQLRDHEGRHGQVDRHVIGGGWLLGLRQIVEQLEVLGRVCLSKNSVIGRRAASQAEASSMVFSV